MLSRTALFFLAMLSACSLVGCIEVVSVETLAVATVTETAPPPTPTDEPTPTTTPTKEAEVWDGGVIPNGSGYTNEDLGVAWTLPDDDWVFLDVSSMELVFEDMVFLTMLLPREESEGRFVILAANESSPFEMRALRWLLEINPELALENFATFGETVEVTEVDGETAIFYRLEALTGDINFAWFVIRSSDLVMIIAQGFDNVGDVEVLLETLDFTDEVNTTVETPSLESLTQEELLTHLPAVTEDLRGLETLEEVPFQFMDSDALKVWLEQETREEQEPDEIAAGERMYKLLGLIPEEADLFQLIFDLQSSQILGFYDPESAVFTIVSREPSDSDALSVEDQVTFVHEYTHALQDQHFDLSRFTEAQEGRYNDDEEIALLSLIEGDASLVTWLFLIDRVSADQSKRLFDAAITEASQDVLDLTPPFLQESLLFPYMQGMAFVLFIYQSGGWEAVNQVWQNPPLSTEQILHPDKYLEDIPTAVELPENLAEALGIGWTESLRDVWGEGQLLMMLEGTTDGFITDTNAAEGADGWGGDQYVYLINGEQDLYIMEVVWDDTFEAAEGYSALLEWLEQIGLENDGGHRFRNGNRSAYLHHKGRHVWLALADDPEVLVAALKVLQWK